MRLALLSDLHCEFDDDGGQAFIESLDSTGADVLILAGDIGLAKREREYEWQISALAERFPSTILVAGNHECYGTDQASVDRFLWALSKRIPNLYYLQDGLALQLGGRRFVGGTMWFPMRPIDAEYKRGMSDFRLITTFDPNAAHERFVRAAEHILPGDIVITHHMPSYQCIAPQFTGSVLNRFFAAPMDDMIHSRKPALWLSGHTHTPYDMRIGDTRLVCNPRGYPHEGVVGFNPNLRIDV